METFLTHHQRETLVRHHRMARRQNSMHADRIKAILMLDEGLSYEEVGRYLLLDDETVRRYFRIYTEDGPRTLMRDDYVGGNSAKLTPMQENELKTHLLENVFPTTKSVCAYVDKTFGVEYSLGGMRHLLRRLDFRYIKPKVVPGKADPKKQEKWIAEYEKIKENLEENDKIYFADACHPLHQSVADYGWMPRGKPRELKTNSGRGRVNLNGAVELNELDVVVRQEESIDGLSVVRLLKELEKRHPNAKKIYFICDNGSYYHSKIVKKFIATSRIKIFHLPTGSPNLNPIERLWKYFRRHVTANIYRENFSDFRRACAVFFGTIRHRKGDLRTLLTDNFERIKVSQS